MRIHLAHIDKLMASLCRLTSKADLWYLSWKQSTLVLAVRRLAISSSDMLEFNSVSPNWTNLRSYPQHKLTTEPHSEHSKRTNEIILIKQNIFSKLRDLYKIQKVLQRLNWVKMTTEPETCQMIWQTTKHKANILLKPDYEKLFVDVRHSDLLQLKLKHKEERSSWGF